MKLKVYLVFGLLIASLAVSFALQNNQQVTIQFFQWNTEMNVTFLILLSTFIGFLINWLLSIPTIISDFFTKIGLKLKVKKLEKTLQKTSKEKESESKKREILEKERAEDEEGIIKIEA